MSTLQKRLLVFAILIVSGLFTGWAAFNLTLDALLGGRTFG